MVTPPIFGWQSTSSNTKSKNPAQQNQSVLQVAVASGDGTAAEKDGRSQLCFLPCSIYDRNFSSALGMSRAKSSSPSLTLENPFVIWLMVINPSHKILPGDRLLFAFLFPMLSPWIWTYLEMISPCACLPEMVLATPTCPRRHHGAT